MSAITVTLSGKTSTLLSYFHPEIELDERFSYSCALLNFHTYNSIANVTQKNNKFYINNGKHTYVASIPEGCYEVKDITEYIKIKILFDVLL